MIKIVTDSTAYVPLDYAEQHNITVIPLRVNYKGEEFNEGFPGTYDEFFADFTKTKIFPKTSQPSVELFIEEFNKATEHGDEVICFTISSTLSGSFNASILAKNSCKNPDMVTCFDSQTACQTTFGYIMEAVEMRDSGKSRAEIVEHLTKLTEVSQVSFVPDSLEYLCKGGRIGKVTATLGTILQLKPILSFKKGTLTNDKKCLGMQRAIGDLLALVPEKIKRIFVIHIANTKFYEMLKSSVDKFLKMKNITAEVYEGEVGPVVATHIGPAIGIAWTGIC